MKSITCPSCGAENSLSNPVVVSFVCPYCDNISYIEQDALQSTGKKSRLSEGFSRLFRGGTGVIDDKKFIVLGRVRYAFGRGFWDEWFVEWDTAETSWITEDNHEFALQKGTQSSTRFSFSSLAVGSRIKFQGTDFQIMEIGEAKCLGIEGFLPKEILPDECYSYIDGVSLDGKQSLGLEYDEGKDAPPRVFIGTWIEHKQLQMDEENYDW